MTNAGKTRIYLAIIAVLVVIIVAMGYKFIVAGSAERADDGRLAVTLEPTERALMLREMREFVVGLQAVAEGLAHDNMKAVATASRAMGMARSHDVPIAMIGKLPLEFKTLALGLHRAVRHHCDGRRRYRDCPNIPLVNLPMHCRNALRATTVTKSRVRKPSCPGVELAKSACWPRKLLANRLPRRRFDCSL